MITHCTLPTGRTIRWAWDAADSPGLRTQIEVYATQLALDSGQDVQVTVWDDQGAVVEQYTVELEQREEQRDGAIY